jgi:hypothetical protein
VKVGSKFILLSALVISVLQSVVHGSLIYTYDFPGGSGLASDQTNSQPSGVTFGDFTRTNVNAAPMPGDTFGSISWSQNGSLDSTVFESFSITADIGFHLNLSSLTFTAQRSATGPQNMEVGLFVSGSASPYATFDFSPSTSTTPYTFNFTALTDNDNVTTATFKFFGWNAGGAGGQLYLDDVGTYGAISSLPEASTLPAILFLVLCVYFEQKWRRLRRAFTRS